MSTSEECLHSETSLTSSVKPTRHDYVQVVDAIVTKDQLVEFITQLEKEDHDVVELALPSLCFLAEKEFDEESFKLLRRFCTVQLLHPKSSRAGRKAVLSCLKHIKLEEDEAKSWSAFYVLAESLEEPQFHIIRPVLPKFDLLVSSVQEKKLDWIWVKVIVYRAFGHTNGWIRAWAFEKSAELDAAVIGRDQDFVLNCLLPALNTNDIFWRMLEKGTIETFLEKLGKLINGFLKKMKEGDSEEESLKLLHGLMIKIEQTSCPAALYYLSDIVLRVEKMKFTCSQELAILFRNILIRVHYTPELVLRYATARNYIIFFSRLISWIKGSLGVFAQLIAMFSDIPQPIIDYIVDSLAVSLDEDDNRPTAQTPELELASITIEFKNFNLQTFKVLSSMWWMWQRKCGTDLACSKLIEKHVGELFSTPVDQKCFENAPNDVSDKINTLLIMSLDRWSNMDEYLSKVDLSGYLLTMLSVTDRFHNQYGIELAKIIYFPLLSLYHPTLISAVGTLVLQLLKEDLSFEIHAYYMYILGMAQTILKDDAKTLGEHGPLVKAYLGKNFLTLPKQTRPEGMSTKEFNSLVSTLYSLRLKTFKVFINQFKVKKECLLYDAIDQLDYAASFNVKYQLLGLISTLLHNIDNAEMTLIGLRAVGCVLNEEKKSLNSLPALDCFVRAAISAQHTDESFQYIMTVIDEQLAVASQSIQVPLVIIKVLDEFPLLIDQKWANLIVKIALSGPVPKKDAKTLNYAYNKIYTSSGRTTMPINELERIDEIVQRARFRAVVLAVVKARECSEFCKKIIFELIEASKEIDKSTSRSFGLSLAHRQKTRLVQLLHLLAPSVKGERDIIDYCIGGMVDPCQQFSIKLILEWTVAIFCVKDPHIFFYVLGKDKEMGHQRIGSVSSWINVLMLCGRAEPKLIKACLGKIVPWTTAQNFPVRCTAIAACQMMYDLLLPEDRKRFELVGAIVDFKGEPAGNSKKIIKNLCSDFYFAHLNILRHFDMRTVFIEIPKKVGMPPEELIPLHVIKELNRSPIRSDNGDLVFLAAPSEVYSNLAKNATCAPDMEDRAEVEEEPIEEEKEASFQRKINKDKMKQHEDTSLIVVASLVDKPTNLGGICRTSEIFGVDKLIVPDVLMVQDFNFKALSMSSENWMNIEAVKEADLLGYLEGLRSQGYKVIAAEQTTDSIMMHEFKFPKKAVVILGKEKEGVPTELLRAVDQTVEIKQTGHTRSLNVHVTAALFISKFAEQVKFAPV